MAGRTGTGATITFGTSSFTCKLISVSGAGASRTAVDVTDMTDLGTDQSSGGTDKVQGVDLSAVVVHKFDEGSVTFKPLECTVSHDPDQVCPVGAAAETITFKSKPVSTQTAGAGFSFTGFVTNYEFDGELDGHQTATLTIQPKGEYTWIDAVTP